MKIALDVIAGPMIGMIIGVWVLIILGVVAVCMACFLLIRHFWKKRDNSKKSDEQKDHDA